MSENHQDVRLLLGAYVLGALDRPDVLQVEEHLSGCPACQDEVADLATLPEVLRRRPPTDAAPPGRPPPPSSCPPCCTRSLTSDAASGTGGPWGRRWRRPWRRSPSAAGWPC